MYHYHNTNLVADAVKNIVNKGMETVFIVNNTKDGEEIKSARALSCKSSTRIVKIFEPKLANIIQIMMYGDILSLQLAAETRRGSFRNTQVVGGQDLARPSPS